MKKALLIVLLVIFSIVIYNLARQIIFALQASSRLDQIAGKVAELQQKNSGLKKKLAETSSLSFIERQARDKLNLARPGETVIIIPDSEIDKILGVQTIAIPEATPNWQGWLKLFFK